jgi:hypothetical protein
MKDYLPEILSLFIITVLICFVIIGTAEAQNTLQNWQKDFFWDAPASSPVPVAGYNFYESQTPGGPWTKINGTLITGTAFNYPQATTGRFYAVSSVADGGIEALSDELHLVGPGKPLFLRLWQLLGSIAKGIWGMFA